MKGRKLDKTEHLLREVYAKYGPWHLLNFYGTQWRIWWTSWHTHPKDNPTCMSGDFSVYGSTLQEAVESALHAEERMIVRRGRCERGCPGFYDGID